MHIHAAEVFFIAFQNGTGMYENKAFSLMSALFLRPLARSIDRNGS